ncbi:DUF1488 family protein [Paracidovorax valerianellae]|uniref:DUF1488 domain-containing protein n=1 Tax=Paracidovorax valerianellae TaxID=187868 RepID=A0A1G7ER26_9BURK|nr:DUF1488 family protein [Paracidovorax valerianellae]MDA8445840.1 DUF1488 family protein [Paracidovorax valerianellae]SDE65876.1 Protein of unknown function [Paracidovorax valerianellae]
MSQPPFFHDASGTVRFWIEIQAQWIGASVGKDTLHHRYCPGSVDEDPLDTYRSHAAEIEQAVRRKVEQGAIEPVMLREFDLRAA